MLNVLIPLPTVVANTVIVPLILHYAYGLPDALPYLFLTVGLGEVLSAWVLGLLLLRVLKKVLPGIHRRHRNQKPPGTPSGGLLRYYPEPKISGFHVGDLAHLPVVKVRGMAEDQRQRGCDAPADGPRQPDARGAE